MRSVLSSRRARAGFLAVLLMLGASGGAGAGGHKDSARRLFQEGLRLYEVAEYGRALESFKKAYLAYDSPAFLYNIARCHRQLGQLEQAVTFYNQYLRRVPNAPDRDEVTRQIAEIERERAATAHAAQDKAAAEQAAQERERATQAERAAQAPAVPSAAATSEPAPILVAHPAPARRPVYKRWWLWTSLVVGAAAVGTGVGLGITLTRSKGGTSLGEFGPGVPAR